MSLIPACDSIAHLTTPVLDTPVFPLGRKFVLPTLLLKIVNRYAALFDVTL